MASSRPPRGLGINPDHPLSRSLVGAWSLNEGTGIAVRDAVAGLAGSLAPGAGWSPSGGIKLDGGTTSRVVLGDTPDVSELTLAVRVTPVAYTPSNYQSLIGKGNTDTSSWTLEIGDATINPRSLRFYIYYNNGLDPSTWLSVADIVPTGVPTMLAVTYRAGVGAIFYADGRPYVGEQVWGSLKPPIENNNIPAVIGSVGVTSRIGVGHFDVAYVWGRCLFDGEMAALAKSPYAPFRRAVPRRYPVSISADSTGTLSASPSLGTVALAATAETPAASDTTLATTPSLGTVTLAATAETPSASDATFAATADLGTVALAATAATPAASDATLSATQDLGTVSLTATAAIPDASIATLSATQDLGTVALAATAATPAASDATLVVTADLGTVALTATAATPAASDATLSVTLALDTTALAATAATPAASDATLAVTADLGTAALTATAATPAASDATLSVALALDTTALAATAATPAASDATLSADQVLGTVALTATAEISTASTATLSADQVLGTVALAATASGGLSAGGRTGWSPDDLRHRPSRGRSIDPSYPLSRSLVAAWSLNEGTGTAVRDAVGGLVGTLIGGASWSPTGGVDFDGSATARIEVGDVPDVAELTLVVRITPAANFGTYQSLIGKGDSNGSAWTFEIDDVSGTRRLRFYIYYNSNVDAVVWSTGDGVVPTGIATTLVVAYRPGAPATFYVDGTSYVGTVTAGSGSPAIENNDVVVKIGSANVGGRVGAGHFDAAYVFGKRLTDDDIKVLSRYPYAPFRVGSVRRSSAPTAIEGYSDCTLNIAPILGSVALAATADVSAASTFTLSSTQDLGAVSLAATADVPAASTATLSADQVLGIVSLVATAAMASASDATLSATSDLGIVSLAATAVTPSASDATLSATLVLGTTDLIATAVTPAASDATLTATLASGTTDLVATAATPGVIACTFAATPALGTIALAATAMASMPHSGVVGWLSSDLRRRPSRGQGIDRTHPLSRSLVAAWCLNEGTGTAVRDAVGGLAGSLATGASWSTTGGITLDGSATAQVLLGDVPDVSDLTLVVRVTPAAYTSSNYQRLIGKGNESTAAWTLEISDAELQRTLRFYIYHGADPTTWRSEADIVPTGVSTLLAVTYQAGVGATFYVDGRPYAGTIVHDGPITPIENNDIPASLGSVPVVNRIGSGHFDAAYVWARCLSAGEMATLAEYPYAPFRPVGIRRSLAPYITEGFPDCSLSVTPALGTVALAVTALDQQAAPSATPPRLKPIDVAVRRGHSLARDLVGFYWAAPDGSIRDAVLGHDPTLVGSPPFAAGPLGACMQLDGSTQHAVVVPDQALQVSGPYTVAAYFRRSRTGVAEHLFANWSEGGGNYHGIVFGPTAANNIRIFHGLGTNVYTPGLTDTTFTDPNRWHHVAAVWDGANYRLYTDGQADGVVAMASPPNWTGNELARIGDVNNGTETLRFAGDVDHVAVWSRALSEGETAILASDPYAPVRVRHPLVLDHITPAALFSSGLSANTSLGTVVLTATASPSLGWNATLSATPALGTVALSATAASGTTTATLSATPAIGTVALAVTAMAPVASAATLSATPALGTVDLAVTAAGYVVPGGIVRWSSADLRRRPSRGMGIDFVHPLARSLVSAWSLNEGTGTVVRDAVAGLAGSLVAGASWAPTGGVDFDGSTTAQVVLGDVPDVSDLTLAVRVTPAIYTPGNYQSLVGKGDNTTTAWTFEIADIILRRSLRFYIYYNNSANYTVWLSAAEVVPMGVPTMLAVSYQAGVGATFYVDGKPYTGTVTGDGSMPSIENNNISVTLGSPQTASRISSGHFDAVYVWSRCLSTDEMALLAEYPFAPFRTGGVRLVSAETSDASVATLSVTPGLGTVALAATAATPAASAATLSATPDLGMVSMAATAVISAASAATLSATPALGTVSLVATAATPAASTATLSATPTLSTVALTAIVATPGVIDCTFSAMPALGAVALAATAEGRPSAGGITGWPWGDLWHRPRRGRGVDPDQSLSRSLVAAWSLNEGTGVAIRDAVAGLAGSLATGASWSSTGGIDLEGSGTSRVDLGDVPDGSDLSLAVRYTPPAHVDDLYQQLIIKGDSDTASWSLEIGDGLASRSLRFYIYYNAGVESTTWSSPADVVLAGVSTTFAVGYRAGVGATFYVDGKPYAGTMASGGPAPLIGDTDIATAIGGSDRIGTGHFDAAYVWSRTLSDAEMAVLAEYPYAPFRPVGVRRFPAPLVIEGYPECSLSVTPVLGTVAMVATATVPAASAATLAPTVALGAAALNVTALAAGVVGCTFAVTPALGAVALVATSALPPARVATLSATPTALGTPTLTATAAPAAASGATLAATPTLRPVAMTAVAAIPGLMDCTLSAATSSLGPVAMTATAVEPPPGSFVHPYPDAFRVRLDPVGFDISVSSDIDPARTRVARY